MTDWEAFRQALPKAAPKELIDWAARTQKDELGGELCLFSRESVSWLEEEPQEIMTPEDIERREKSRRRTWGARCTCTACGEDFAGSRCYRGTTGFYTRESRTWRPPAGA